MNLKTIQEQKFNILKNVFGYHEFRSLQSEIIDSVLSKKDTLVIVPTGGGKSLCYQIPALIFQGLTLVISPLIALMKDQTDQLTELGIKSVFLNSSLSPEEYSLTIQKIFDGQIKLVYLAPEALPSYRIQNLLSQINVELLTVDEAHCISEWGHDFRPDYRNIIELRKFCPNATILAVTATATQKVREDIKDNLQLKNTNEFIASFNRGNLFFDVQPKINPESQTLDFLKKFPNQSGIIYCHSRAQVEALSLFLQKKGFSVKPYHAGLDDTKRKHNQELFIKDDVKIIVATIAFGMGINKPNVRFVIHYDLPKSIESYYQEIGRAGRDGLKAHCLLLYNYNDKRKNEYFINKIEEYKFRRIAKVQLDAIISYAQATNCRRKPLLKYFGEIHTKDFCGMCNNCLNTDIEFTDLTVEAKKFLSCVKKTGEIFGIQYIIDVLRGSKSQKILNNNHDKLTTYGIGKEYSQKQWLHFANQFLENELLIKTPDYASLKLTSKAWDLFKDKIKFSGIKEIVETDYAKAKIKDLKFDNDLYNLLKEKRKFLSEKQGVPPYAIFNDRTLIEMSTFFPKSENSLYQIHGVGRIKYIKYGEIFINLIKEYCEVKSIEEIPKNQIATNEYSLNPMKEYKFQIIGKEFESGHSLDDIKNKYHIKTETVCSHLYRNLLEGKIFEPEKIKALIKLEQKDIDILINSFDIWGIESLKSIYDDHEGKFSYDDISIVRLYYICLHPEEITANID